MYRLQNDIAVKKTQTCYLFTTQTWLQLLYSLQSLLCLLQCTDNVLTNRRSVRQPVGMAGRLLREQMLPFVRKARFEYRHNIGGPLQDQWLTQLTQHLQCESRLWSFDSSFNSVVRYVVFCFVFSHWISGNPIRWRQATTLQNKWDYLRFIKISKLMILLHGMKRISPLFPLGSKLLITTLKSGVMNAILAPMTPLDLITLLLDKHLLRLANIKVIKRSEHMLQV